MPRVAIKKEQYKLTDFSKWILAQLKLNDMNQSDLAQALGVERSTLTKKLQRSNFSLKEIITILNYFKADETELKKLLIY